MRKEAIEVCMLLSVLGMEDSQGLAGARSLLPLSFSSCPTVIQVSQGGALVPMANYSVDNT